MKYLFGPVNSGRLGRSLGIDLIPYKICNFDCVYCECGMTPMKRIKGRGRFVKLPLLMQEVEDYISDQSEDGFDVVTLTGSGETTLERQLGKIIQYLHTQISKPVAVLTNASLMIEPDVQEDLALADIVLPSLDAAVPSVFKKVDQPAPWITVENIILGMIDFRNKYPLVQFWLEVLLVEGVNDQEENIQSLKKAIKLIRPHRVDVMTVTRPPAYASVKAIPEEKLKAIQKELSPEGCGEVKRRSDGRNYQSFNKILEMVKRRPCLIEDMPQKLGLKEEELLEGFKTVFYEGKQFLCYRPS